MSINQRVRGATPSITREIRAVRMTRLWLVTGAVLLLLLTLSGLVLRVVQTITGLGSYQFFYALLTLHGTGMATLSLIMIAVVFWYVMQSTLPLSVGVMGGAYLLTMAGMLLLVVAALRGYGTGWTMLYPLTSTPGPVPSWGRWDALAFMLGFALMIGAFALWSLDFLRAGIAHYGGLGRMLGLDILTGTTLPGQVPVSPAVIAGTVAAVDGLAAVFPGSLIISLLVIDLFVPSFEINPLLAKNLLFFAGHTFTNIQIYIGAGLMYALLPAYTRRPWKVNRVLVFSWLITLILIMLASFHHLYQDFAQPLLVQMIGAIASYASAFPAILVTIFGALLLVYRSALHWRVTPLLLYTGFAAWAIGGYAAIIDSSPWLNHVLHHTLWVPAYFHTFMALAVMFLLIGAVYHIMPDLTGQSLSEAWGRQAAILLGVGGWGLVLTWYVSGVLGQPRRYPYYLPHLAGLTWVGVACALLVTIGVVIIFSDCMRVIIRAYRDGKSTNSQE